MPKELTFVDYVVESIYHRATEKPSEFISEGGLPAESRWWDAIEQAYWRGVQDTRDGLHNKQ